MNLRSGTRVHSEPPQNILNLRSGRKIHIPKTKTVSNEEKRKKTVSETTQPAENKKMDSKQRLWPFTEESLNILKTLPSNNAKPSKIHSKYVSQYQSAQQPFTFVNQFIPTFDGGMVVCYGQLKIVNNKKNEHRIVDIFQSSWHKLDNLLMPEYKKSKASNKKKKVILPKAGYLVGLCYNLLLVRDDDPESGRVWRGHANVSSSATNEHSIIEPVQISNSVAAYDFCTNVSRLPHLQMANHWYQTKFSNSEEKVYSVLDLVFTFQQFISDPTIIQHLEPLTRRIIRL